MPVVTLRPAAVADAERLRAWRNDPVSRHWSFVPGEVGAEEHARWLQSKLADRDCHLWIGEQAGRAVSQVRLQATDTEGVAEVSITVAPAARGAGIAVATLAAAAAQARVLGLRCLVARIKPANEASIGAFVKADFRLDADPPEDPLARRYVLDL